MSRGLKEVGAAADLFAHGKPRQEPVADHDGHRQRLRDRFANAGPGALHDYELLELVLFDAIPRRDTKPLAKALLRQFNDSFAEVVNASPARLKEVKGVSDRVVHQFRLVREVALRRCKQDQDADAVLVWALEHYSEHPEIQQLRQFMLHSADALLKQQLHHVGLAGAPAPAPSSRRCT